MNPFLYFVDSLSAWVGKAFGWCIMVLTFATCYEVFMRYVLNAPTAWAFDMAVQMYGALFMMAGAYTLSRNGHVRGDVIHRLLPVRVQAGIDLALYILFLLPGVLALIWYGYEFAADSWRQPLAGDPDGSGFVDVLDFLYINLDDEGGSCP